MTNIDRVKLFYTLRTDGEKQAALDMIAADAVWHSDEIGAPWSGVHRGKEAINEHFEAISGTTEKFRRYDQKFIEQGEWVIELGSLSCILNKTKKPFDTEYVCLYTIEGGKITSYRIFEDSLKLYRAYFGHSNVINHRSDS